MFYVLLLFVNYLLYIFHVSNIYSEVIRTHIYVSTLVLVCELVNHLSAHHHMYSSLQDAAQ